MTISGPVPRTRSVARIPATMMEIRRLFDALDWNKMASQVEEETMARVAIVGPVNSGKSTLFNTLKGREISQVAAVPGTTRELQHEQWGPFTLTDTPGFGEVDGVDRANIALQGVQAAQVVVVVLDAISGVRQADLGLIQQIRAKGKPVVTVLNKIDLLREERDRVIADARDKLGEPDLIPISAKRGTNIARLLIPRLIDSHTALAVAVGRSLPAYRRQAANKVVRGAAAINAIIGTEPIPGLDIPFLLAVQGQMVLRIAAIYGEPMSAQHAKELMATIGGGLALRFLAQGAAKLVPGPGWVIAGTIASAGTWTMGQVAIQYFDFGGKLSATQLRGLYKQRIRARRKSRALKRGAIRPTGGGTGAAEL
ncbi:GTPase [Chloroflexota bacterium]